MSTVLLVQVDPALASLLRQSVGTEDQLKEASAAEEGIVLLEQVQEDIDVLVLGARLPDPVRLAQRARALHEDLTVVILSDPRRLRALRRTVQFAPFLGSNVVCQSTEQKADLAEAFREIVTRARQRRNYRALVQAVQSRLPNPTATPGSTRPYLDTLLEHAPLGVVVISADEHVLVCNRHARILFGLAEREMIGRVLPDLFPASERERLRSYIARAAAARMTPETFERKEPDGEAQYVEVTATSMADSTEVLGMMVLLQDITGRVRAEEEAQRLGQQAAVSAALARQADELRQLNRVLEQRNQELEEFTYVASHDLQEPLRKIQAFSDLLRGEYRDVVDAEGQHYLERIEDAAGRMSRLLSDLLAYSRITTRARPFEKVDLNAVVANVCADLEVLTADVGGTVEVDHLPTIEADPTQMYQLLQNLIGNALKFRREDTPPVVHVTGSTFTVLLPARHASE